MEKGVMKRHLRVHSDPQLQLLLGHRGWVLRWWADWLLWVPTIMLIRDNMAEKFLFAHEVNNLADVGGKNRVTSS